MLLSKHKVIFIFEQHSILGVQAVLKCGLQAEAAVRQLLRGTGTCNPHNVHQEASRRLILLLESAPEPKRIFILTLGRREWGGRCRGKECEEIKGTGLG